uniref:Uncharacterized protein n=1 Tax=Anguilla anguilla TaxID=7936 RepID=A0A0E9TZV8_ANGAN
MDSNLQASKCILEQMQLVCRCKLRTILDATW